MNWLEFWYKGLNAEHGIRILTTDAFEAIKQLHAARKSSGDPALDTLVAIVPIEAGKEVWIMREKAYNEIKGGARDQSKD